MKRNGLISVVLVLTGLVGLARVTTAAPMLIDASVGTLELLTPDPGEQAKLNQVDGLAFDSFGNLFGVLEISGSDGGVVYVDKVTGSVTKLVSGIRRADQIALHISGDLFVTSEVQPASRTDRVYRVTVGYDMNNVPDPSSTSATSLTTSLAINNPEGLIVLETNNLFGNAGDLYVGEDMNPGSIFRVQPSDGTSTTLISGLARPEGMAFGGFDGGPALYTAETSDNNVLRIESDGSSVVFGNPASVNLSGPDNVEFGPDGFLYVSEDRSAPNSRIVRIAANGTHSVFATGFGKAAGMAFDPENGDMYIAEQALDRIWRVRFNAPPRPSPSPPHLATW